MLSAAQLQQIIAENEQLHAQLQELNEILAIKQDEIDTIKSNTKEDAELRSMVDMQLEELHLMQNRIGKHQQKAAGAEEREFELHQELVQAAKVSQQNDELFKQYTYLTSQLDDMQQELIKVKKRNNMLQQIAVKIGEMESSIEILAMERDELKSKVAELERLQAT